MNAPPLIRPLRAFMQRRLPTSSILAQSGLLSQTSQARSNASISKPPPTEQSIPDGEAPPTPEQLSRMPRNVQAFYLKPLRREAEYGVPSCDLQLRSYSIRNLEFFCDFALRAAYYLGLPAFGPTPLPKITERWTVPRASFIFKKSQENFERITRRRLIQIRDGHPETVQMWLAFLQKHQYYGVGMKANMWEFSKLGVGKEMEEGMKEIEGALESQWEHLSDIPKKTRPTVEKVEELLASERFKITGGR